MRVLRHVGVAKKKEPQQQAAGAGAPASVGHAPVPEVPVEDPGTRVRGAEVKEVVSGGAPNATPSFLAWAKGRGTEVVE